MRPTGIFIVRRKRVDSPPCRKGDTGRSADSVRTPSTGGRRTGSATTSARGWSGTQDASSVTGGEGPRSRGTPRRRGGTGGRPMEVGTNRSARYCTDACPDRDHLVFCIGCKAVMKVCSTHRPLFVGCDEKCNFGHRTEMATVLRRPINAKEIVVNVLTGVWPKKADWRSYILLLNADVDDGLLDPVDRDYFVEQVRARARKK